MRRVLMFAVLAVFTTLTQPARAQFCPGALPWVFDDVLASDPFCGFITWAAQNGITLGCAIIDANHRLYCPGDPVRRDQMAAFVNRLGNVRVEAVGTGPGLTGGPITGIGTINLAATNLLPTTPCANNQIPRWNGSAWVCANDANSGGTVTSVGTGTGLTGGPITTSGTVSIAGGFQLPQGCTIGQVAKSDGIGGWTCASDTTGTGTVTSVATGTGLTGGTITTSGTISIAASGVGATQLASNAVQTAKIVDLAVTTPKIADASVTSAKLADGAITVDKLASGLPRPMAKSVSNHVSGGNGQQSSIVMGVDGLPLIAFYDQTNQQLRVLHCDTVDCSASTPSTIDPGPGVGQDPSITMISTNVAAISYFGAGTTSLKIAICADAACTTASVATVDATNDTGHFSSIMSAPNAGILISYYDNTLKDLKLAQCNNSTTCNAPTILTVTSAGDVGQWSAMTVLGNGDIAIAYHDATAHLLRLATCPSFSSCNTPTLTTVEILGTDVAEGIAITTNHAGNAVVSYVRRAAGGSGSKKVAVCESFACAAPVITPLQSVSSTQPAVRTSVTITPDGLPVIAMSANVGGGGTCDSANSSSGGGFAKCRRSDCSLFDTGDSLGVATNPAITTGADGVPIASMWGCSTIPASTDLKTIHCASLSCQGNFRPR